MKRLAQCMGAALFAALVLGSAAGKDEPDREQTRRHHHKLPLVYDVENTGARYPAPVFPSFDQLPIIRPLPDPFVFFDGRRNTSFASWERRRNEIKASIENHEIGPKPDCSDCTITASYTPPATGSTAKGVLTVVVTRNGKSLTLTSGVYVPPVTDRSSFPALIPMTFFARPSGANPGN